MILIFLGGCSLLYLFTFIFIRKMEED